MTIRDFAPHIATPIRLCDTSVSDCRHCSICERTYTPRQIITGNDKVFDKECKDFSFYGTHAVLRY